MDDELSRQQRNSEKQLATEQDSLRCLKTEENTFTTSIGAARIATKVYKNWRRRDNCSTSKIVAPAYSGFAYPENKAGGARIFTQSNRQRNDPTLRRDWAVRGTTQRYSGIGQFVSYQTCTGLRQHGYRLLLETEPETVDPGHRSMLRKRIPLTVKSRMLIQHHSIKDAISITTIRASIGKHEFLHSIESTTYHFPELQQEDL